MSRVLVIVSVAMAIAGCGHDSQEPTPPAVVELHAPGDVQPADSTIRMQLSSRATGDFYPKVVTFRTGGGIFFPGGADRVTVPLDKAGWAWVTLRPPEQAGVITISASAGGTTVFDSVRFSRAILEPLLDSVYLSREAAPADGLSTIIVEARLSPRGARTVSEVSFRATAGLFTTGKDNIEVGLDGTGVARTTLVAPTKVTVGEVVATAANEQLVRSVTFLPPPSPFRTISVLPDSVPADGASVIVVTVARDPAAVHVRDIVLEASKGSFLPGSFTRDTAHFDALGSATALLQAPGELGVLLLRAFGPSGTLQRQVTLVPALADRIEISGPGQYDPSGGEVVAITATLSRVIGAPSRGLDVLMDARTAAGDSVGIWLSKTRSDANGRATGTWMITDAGFSGTVLLRARTRSSSGGVISATYPLKVVRP